MSINLHLGIREGPKDQRKRFSLWQTPSNITEAVMLTPGEHRVIRYFLWLDSLVEQGKPFIDPRLTGKALAGRKRAADWVAHREYERTVREHKQAVKKFLADNPNAEWWGH